MSAQVSASPATRRCLRLVLAIALAIAFADAVIRISATLLYNTDDGTRAVDVAVAVAAGRARWGVTDYTHHPLLPAYALVPVIRMGRPDLIQRVPAVIGALAGASALAVLLFLAPWPLWPGVLAWFAALLWQPGYTHWLSNTWQHSWNLSVVFVLIALGCTLRRAAPWLMLVGYVAGWIGYDFIFVQVATLIAVRLAFWSQVSPWRALLAAGDEAIAFVTGIALAFLSHLIQNVLYFSSAMMAVDDLLWGVFIRVNNSNELAPTLAMRWGLLQQLAVDYVRLFLLPLWSHWRSLALAAAVASAVGLVAWWQVGRTRRVALPLAAVVASALGGLAAWWTIAPGHAIPHTHLFPRMLLVPPLAILAGTVRVLSATPPPTAVRWRLGWRHALTAAAIVALQPSLLHSAAARLDERIYTHVWATTDSAPRRDRIDAPFLPATSPQAPGPATLKAGLPLVGGVNVWAQDLDETRWQPAPEAAWVYDERFAAPAVVDEVLLRFPGPARPQGALRAFTIELLGAPPATALDQSSPGLEITEVGFLRCFRYRLNPPVVADGLRLTVRDAERVPVLYDLLAFGHSISSPGANP